MVNQPAGGYLCKYRLGMDPDTHYRTGYRFIVQAQIRLFLAF